MTHYTASVSARRKKEDAEMKDYIADQYPDLTLDQIDSVFGFAEHTMLYGGKLWRDVEISPDDLTWMYDNNIGFRIPLTNVVTTKADYQNNIEFIRKYHRPGNSIICVQNWFADAIKNDFPDYSVEASVIKAVSTMEELELAFEHFDTIVPLAEAFNENFELLDSIKEKHRIRLFLQVGCALHCPNRICYTAFSKFNRDEKTPLLCSAKLDERAGVNPEVTMWDMNEYIAHGFTKFKAHKPEVVQANALVP